MSDTIITVDFKCSKCRYTTPKLFETDGGEWNKQPGPRKVCLAADCLHCHAPMAKLLTVQEIRNMLKEAK